MATTLELFDALTEAGIKKDAAIKVVNALEQKIQDKSATHQDIELSESRTASNLKSLETLIYKTALFQIAATLTGMGVLFKVFTG